jgi:penicillin G amidase
LACGILVALAVALVHAVLLASLPELDGQLQTGGLISSASIERDALGIPTISAASRADLAYATGFVHAQDRFFQMDLSRRLAAGELTQLFGAAAAAQDAKARVFNFRNVARRVLEQATPAQRAIVSAYARGANAGVASLRSRPWEYWVLRSKPVSWRDEDTVLVVHAMWWDLQYGDFRSELLRREILARTGGAGSFFYPNTSEWTDPVPVPGPDVLNVFHPGSALRGRDVGLRGLSPTYRASNAGSNNWAVAGRLTSTGGALVASDMHLNLRVPTTWYRARLQTGGLDLNGLTLPGAPVLVAGSNGHIAWGFTNSYGDWADLDERPCESRGRGVRFAESRKPGQCWFAHWLAAVPEATNFRLLDFEKAMSVEQALVLAPETGIPHQNLVVGDRAGHIAWTIAGRIPEALGTGRNDGPPWIAFENHPRIVDPPQGRLWTANARATNDLRQQAAIGGDEAMLGAGYDLGARAKQIHDDLSGLAHPATPADMLAIQLDDRARFLARWRGLMLELLDAQALHNQPRRQHVKRLLADWNGRASVDSMSYRLVREYRNRTELAVWRMLLLALDIPHEEARPPAKFEQPLWTLVTRQPRHMLAADYGSWRELLLSQIDLLMADGSGKRDPVRIRHPLSAALPLLAPLLDMPSVELPGDHDMPRVQDGSFGASERFAVTPGLESRGYLHIAGGQSGHPLSPFYRAGFREWAQGKPLPFIPGTTTHRLVLEPR